MDPPEDESDDVSDVDSPSDDDSFDLLVCPFTDESPYELMPTEVTVDECSDLLADLGGPDENWASTASLATSCCR